VKWSGWVAAGALLVAGLGGCSGGAGPGAETPSGATPWVTAPGKPDLRRMTTLIKVAPPPAMKELFEAMASHTQSESMAEFFRSHAEGGHGTGFIVVHEHKPTNELMVVTNRHVVQFAQTAEIVLNDGKAYKSCEVLYTDDTYDLGVLMFPRGNTPFQYGLALDNTGVQDRQVVVATGFPSLGGKPSYQTTDGKVSNCCFELEDGGSRHAYIQHTAPIDPGSSGGPLTSENGAVIGVNTIKVVGRDSVYLAVPADGVITAIRRALEVKSKRTEADWKKKALIQACKSLEGELASENAKIEVLEGLISNAMVGERGFESFQLIAKVDDKLIGLFAHDPIDAMRWSIVKRLWIETRMAGGVSPLDTCERMNPADLAQIATQKQIRMKMQLAQGERELAWTFEHGHWRLANVLFENVTFSDEEEPSEASAALP
jgi:serine protease Do